MAVFGKEAASVLSAVDSQQQRLTFQRLVALIFLARDIAAESRDSQEELLDRISSDEYMKYAVAECYYSIKFVLIAILEEVGRKWFVRLDKSISLILYCNVDTRLLTQRKPKL